MASGMEDLGNFMAQGLEELQNAVLGAPTVEAPDIQPSEPMPQAPPIEMGEPDMG